MAEPTAVERLVALRSRLLRARQQASLLQGQLQPQRTDELQAVLQHITLAWNGVHALLEPMVAPAWENTDECVEQDQRRIASELKAMARGDVMGDNEL